MKISWNAKRVMEEEKVPHEGFMEREKSDGRGKGVA